MDIANMRANGVRSLDARCDQRRHEVILNVDHQPTDLTGPSLGLRMVCTKCGTVRRRCPAELEGTRWQIACGVGQAVGQRLALPSVKPHTDILKEFPYLGAPHQKKN